jgi:beta-aspartyl-peptidase (threonine type)
MPGRVGDSPMPGCGFYADDLFGGAAFSGEGESIARLTLAARVLQVLESGSAGRAAAAAIDQLARIDGEAGTIVLDKAGRFGVAHNSDHFAVALAASGHTAPVAGLHQDELKEWLDHG